MLKFETGLKNIILIIGLIAALYVLADIRKEPVTNIALAIIAAGCFIAFALIENNDVRESNKE
jgi:hypothetical protein